MLVKTAFQRKFEEDDLETKRSSWMDNLESIMKLVGEQEMLNDAGGAAL